MRCKVGDIAHIIDSVDGLNVGKTVEVCSFQGEHSKYGPIWRVRIVKGDQLVSEYGGVGLTVDCADDWLRPIPPEAVPNKQVELAA